jgi:hypothetical protein
MTIDHQDAEKKAQALLKFALGNHNAKRYGEAAGFYEVVLKQYPNTEAAQFAHNNLGALVKKLEGLEAIQPDETLLTRIEQSTGSEPVQNQASPPPAKPLKLSATASKPPQDTSVSASEPQPGTLPKWKRLRITENPYLLAGLFFLTAVAGYFVGREHVKYEIGKIVTGATDGFLKSMAGSMNPLKNLGQIPASPPTESKVKPAANKPKVLTFPVRLEATAFKEIGGIGLIRVSLTIENPIDRPLKAFEGRLFIKDVFGKLIYERSLSYLNRVAAKSNASWSMVFQHAEFIEKDQLVPELVIEKVAYEDGTIEEFPKPR